MRKLPTREEYEKRERDKADMEHEISIRLSRPALLNEIETLREHIAELEQALKMATDTIAEYQQDIIDLASDHHKLESDKALMKVVQTSLEDAVTRRDKGIADLRKHIAGQDVRIAELIAERDQHKSNAMTAEYLLSETTRAMESPLVDKAHTPNRVWITDDPCDGWGLEASDFLGADQYPPTEYMKANPWVDAPEWPECTKESVNHYRYLVKLKGKPAPIVAYWNCNLIVRREPLGFIGADGASISLEDVEQWFRVPIPRDKE